MEETNKRQSKQKKDDKSKESKTRKKPAPEQKFRTVNGGKLKSGNTVNVGRPPTLPDIKKVMSILLGREVAPDKTQMDLLMGRLMDLAMDGDTKAAQILLERGYGKPRETIEIAPESQIKKVIEVSFKDP